MGSAIGEGEQEAGARSSWRRLAPWLISLALHGVLVMSLFAIVWHVLGPETHDRARVVISFDDPGMAPSADIESDEVMTPSEPAPMDRSPSPAGPTFEPQRIDADLPPRPANNMLRAPAPPTELLHQVTSARRAPRVQFAGLGASNARDVVYVVDASGSMVAEFKFVATKLEQSLRRLDPAQLFHVIVFGPGREGYQWARLPGLDPRTQTLLPATMRNVDHVARWIHEVIPSGRSNPTMALQMALELEPDAVFVLSSSITGLGVWEPDRDALLQQIDALNPVDPRTGMRPVVIKTIQVLEPDPAGILEAIGRTHGSASGGEDGYNFLSREELTGR